MEHLFKHLTSRNVWDLLVSQPPTIVDSLNPQFANKFLSALSLSEPADSGTSTHINSLGVVGASSPNNVFKIVGTGPPNC